MIQDQSMSQCAVPTHGPAYVHTQGRNQWGPRGKLSSGHTKTKRGATNGRKKRGIEGKKEREEGKGRKTSIIQNTKQ